MKSFARLAILGAATLASFSAMAGMAQAADRNHDRIPDRWEKRYHLKMNLKQTFRNQDGDELFNLMEYLADTNPRVADTDGDGYTDGLENADGDAITNGEEQYVHANPRTDDSDGDGTTDGNDDTDGDGMPDGLEFIVGADPMNDCDDDQAAYELAQAKKRSNWRWVQAYNWFEEDYFDNTQDSCPTEA